MIYQVHSEIRHAYEMSCSNDPSAPDWRKLLEQCLNQMEEHLNHDMSIVLTYKEPVSAQEPSEAETAFTLRTLEELRFYRNIVGADASTLRNQIHAAKLQKALSETNFNQGGQAIRPIIEPRKLGCQ